MAEILGFIHPRWLFGISSINSMVRTSKWTLSDHFDSLVIAKFVSNPWTLSGFRFDLFSKKNGRERFFSFPFGACFVCFLGRSSPSLQFFGVSMPRHHCKVDTTVTMVVCLCILIAWLAIFALAVILPLSCEKWARKMGAEDSWLLGSPQ